MIIYLCRIRNKLLKGLNVFSTNDKQLAQVQVVLAAACVTNPDSDVAPDDESSRDENALGRGQSRTAKRPNPNYVAQLAAVSSGTAAKKRKSSKNKERGSGCAQRQAPGEDVSMARGDEEDESSATQGQDVQRQAQAEDVAMTMGDEEDESSATQGQDVGQASRTNDNLNNSAMGDDASVYGTPGSGGSPSTVDRDEGEDTSRILYQSMDLSVNKLVSKNISRVYTEGVAHGLAERQTLLVPISCTIYV